MQVLVHTDNHITGKQDFIERAETSVRAAIGHHADRITRVEIHLSDENGPKGGDADIRCAIEARPAGRQPLAVTHHAADRELAVEGAAERLERLLTSEFDRRDNHKGQTSFAGDQSL